MKSMLLVKLIFVKILLGGTMKITMLVDNVSQQGLKAKHGLSLYIEVNNHKALFDLGPDDTFIKNAKLKNIDLRKVDIVVISHGHIDHGGGLKHFLKLNNRAKIYIQKDGFAKHYSKLGFLKIPIGLNKEFAVHNQVVVIEGNHKITDNLEVFTVKTAKYKNSPANKVLYQGDNIDSFTHEQHLVVSDNEVVALFAGCSHSGVENIIETAKCYKPNVFIGGFHLIDPFTKRLVSNQYIDNIGSAIGNADDITFYTCHCTSMKGYLSLANKLENIKYLRAGDQIQL